MPALPAVAETQGLLVKRISLPPPKVSASEAPSPSPAAPAPSSTAALEKPAAGKLHEAALASYRAGDLSAAASSWKKMIAAKPSGTYTLQIAAACEAKTITESFRAFEKLGQPFAVPFRTGGRECFRLCLGTYPSKGAAKKSLAALPAASGKGLIIKNVKLLLR